MFHDHRVVFHHVQEGYDQFLVTPLMMISSRFLRIYGKITSPGVFTAVPSAIVSMWRKCRRASYSFQGCLHTKFAPAGYYADHPLIFGFVVSASVETPRPQGLPSDGTRM